MKELFIQIVNMSITASWLVFVIALIRLVFKKAPKSMICFLWLFVAIRLIVPFSFESALSLIPSTQVIPDEIIEVAPNPSVNDQSQSNVSGNDTQIVIPNENINDNLSVVVPSDEQNVPVQNEIQWMEILPWCWICGILMMTGYAVYSYQKIVRQVQISINKEENIWICDDLSSPFILGVLNPRIYVPSYLSETEMKYVLAHEKAHLKRFDHLWKPLGYTLLAIYWFNPVIWAAYILLCSDIELACDEKVIKTLGDDNKVEYSRTLLSCSVPRNMILACPLAFGEVSVKQRVKSVLHYKKPAFWVLVVALLICIALPVFFLSDPETPISKALNDDVYEYAKTMATGHIETVLGYEPESNYSLHKVQGTEDEFPYIYQVTKDEEPILLVEFEYDTSIHYSGFSFDYGEGYLIPKVKDKYFRNYESDEYLYSVELNSEMDYELYQSVTVQHLDYTYHEEAMDKLMDYLSNSDLGYMCPDLEGFELHDGDLVQLGAPVLIYKIALNEENKTIEIIQINHFDYPVYINHELKTVFSIYIYQEEGEAGYGFVPINKYPMLKDEKLIRIQTGTLYLQELLVTEDGIVNDDAVYPLYVDNTMDTLKMLVQGLNDSEVNFPLEIRVVNEQSVVVPYELYIQNLQTTHYKNGVLFFKMAPDNPGNKRAFSKMFSVDSVLNLQILREDEWQTVCEYPLKNVDREIKDRQFIEFAEQYKEVLMPFGRGLEKPVFATYGVFSPSYRVMKDKHIKTSLVLNEQRIEMLWFNSMTQMEKFKPVNKKILVVGEPGVNRFNGRETLQIIADRVIPLDIEKF